MNVKNKRKIEQLCDVLLNDSYIISPNIKNIYIKNIYVQKTLILLIETWRNDYGNQSEIKELNNIIGMRNIKYVISQHYAILYEQIFHVIYSDNEGDIKWEDTVEFTFPIKGGRVIKVYDADTITIASKLPYNDSPMYRLSVRLNGIDTPEIKGKDITNEEIYAMSELREDK